MLTHLYTAHEATEEQSTFCGRQGPQATEQPTCPDCLERYLSMIGAGMRASARDAHQELELQKARRQQEQINAGARTAETRQVQSLTFEDGRRIGVMRVLEGGNTIEAWPLDGAKFRAGEVLWAAGKLHSGKECQVEFRVGKRCGPRGRVRIRKVGVKVKLTIQPAEEQNE